MMKEILDLLQIHGPIGAVLIVLGIVGRKHMLKDSEEHKAMDVRLDLLEQDRVRQADLIRVHDRLNELTQQNSDNHAEVLGHLIALAGSQPKK